VPDSSTYYAKLDAATPDKFAVIDRLNDAAEITCFQILQGNAAALRVPRYIPRAQGAPATANPPKRPETRAERGAA